MFSNVSANIADNLNENNSWDNIFSLAVDQNYDASHEKDIKSAEEEANYFSLDLSFDEDSNANEKLEKDLSDSSSSDNESVGTRANSCISINSFYTTSLLNEAKPKFTSFLTNNFLKTISEVKAKASEIVNTQKTINAQKMLMVNMLQKQAMIQMIAKTNALKSKIQEQQMPIVAVTSSN